MGIENRKMEKLSHVFDQITQLTNTLESNYPELYRTLDENPLTIPSTNHPDIDIKIMEEYLQSLRELLRRHSETHDIS